MTVALSNLAYCLVGLVASNRIWKQVVWDQVVSLDRRRSVYAPDTEFLNFVVGCRSLSSSQLFQDLWVLWETRLKRGGFFVEFGATDGLSLSNTAVLEKEFGWKGILVEPFSYWHEQLHGNRSAAIDHRCVWRSSGERLRFIGAAQHPEVSGLEIGAFADEHKEVRGSTGAVLEVDTVSLLDLLENHRAPKTIDYLSVDTEGTELEILSSFDFSAYRIDLITVEHNFNDEKRKGIHGLLESKGFTRRFERFSRFDDWYVNRSPQR